jgi:hypothetical protein
MPHSKKKPAGDGRGGQKLCRFPPYEHRSNGNSGNCERRALAAREDDRVEQ